MTTLTQYSHRIRKTKGTDAKWRAVHEAYASDDEIDGKHVRQVMRTIDVLRQALLAAISAAEDDLLSLDDSCRGTFETGNTTKSAAEKILVDQMLVDTRFTGATRTRSVA